jgi:hypothetical protein
MLRHGWRAVVRLALFLAPGLAQGQATSLGLFLEGGRSTIRNLPSEFGWRERAALAAQARRALLSWLAGCASLGRPSTEHWPRLTPSCGPSSFRRLARPPRFRPQRVIDALFRFFRTNNANSGVTLHVLVIRTRAGSARRTQTLLATVGSEAANACPTQR